MHRRAGLSHFQGADRIGLCGRHADNLRQWGDESQEGKASASGALPETGKEGNRAAHGDIDPTEAYSPDIGP